MEDQSYVPFAPTDDGADQGTELDCGEAVCRDEVSGSQGSGSHWTSRPGQELEAKAFYKVQGAFLNHLYQSSVDHFNEANAYPTEPFSYSQAFWNGYGCAIAGLRDIIREHPVDPEVQ